MFPDVTKEFSTKHMTCYPFPLSILTTINCHEHAGNNKNIGPENNNNNNKNTTRFQNTTTTTTTTMYWKGYVPRH